MASPTLGCVLRNRARERPSSISRVDQAFITAASHAAISGFSSNASLRKDIGAGLGVGSGCGIRSIPSKVLVLYLLLCLSAQVAQSSTPTSLPPMSWAKPLARPANAVRTPPLSLLDGEGDLRAARHGLTPS